MGLLDDLQIEVNVDLDTSDIDNILGKDFGEVGNWVMEPLIPIFEEMKTAITEGCEESAKFLSDKSRSLQELYIGLNGSVMTGRLLDSITERQQSSMSYLIGTDIQDHFYPLCVENGRREVVPKTKPFLAWQQLDGKWVRTKYSSPAKPRPYVQPAFEQVEGMAEDVTWRLISDAIK